MSRAAETQNEIIERWKNELTRIARTIHHPDGEGARRECVDLGDILARLGIIVGETFAAGTTYGLELAAMPRCIVLGAHSQAEADFTAASGFNYDPASINEAFSDLLVYDPYKSHRHVAETLGPSPLGDLPDPRGPLPKVEVKAHGPVWPEPATGGPASIPLAGERQGCGEPLTLEALKERLEQLYPAPDGQPRSIWVHFTAEETCDACGHQVHSHDRFGCGCGCNVTIRDFAERLITKARGTGEQP